MRSHLSDVPVSASTPSKFPTTRSPVRAGRAASSSPRPLSGGTPSAAWRCPRLMSPTKAELDGRRRAGRGGRRGRDRSGGCRGGGQRVGRGRGVGAAARVAAQAASPARASARPARRIMPARRGSPLRPSGEPPPAAGEGAVSRSHHREQLVHRLRHGRAGERHADRLHGVAQLEPVGLGQRLERLENPLGAPLAPARAARARRPRSRRLAAKAGPIFRDQRLALGVERRARRDRAAPPPARPRGGWSASGPSPRR